MLPRVIKIALIWAGILLPVFIIVLDRSFKALSMPSTIAVYLGWLGVTGVTAGFYVAILASLTVGPYGAGRTMPTEVPRSSEGWHYCPSCGARLEEP